MSSFFEQKASIQTVKFSFQGKEIETDILREDALHPIVSGNKIRKLRYWVEKCVAESKNRVLSFGGPYSNHLAALAFVLNEYQVEGKFLVRDSPSVKSSKTLAYCRSLGMKIELISYSDYRKRNDEEYIQELANIYGRVLIIPEGGSGSLGIKGVKDMVDDRFAMYDKVYCPVGTGATVYGLALGLNNFECMVEGVSAVPQKYLNKVWLKNLLPNAQINFDFLFGGYGKLTDDLISFIHSFYMQTGVLLDPVYTSKSMYCLAKSKAENTKTLLIHTGGLQGFTGMLEQFPWVKELLPQELVGKL